MNPMLRTRMNEQKSTNNTKRELNLWFDGSESSIQKVKKSFSFAITMAASIYYHLCTHDVPFRFVSIIE
ncbi:hypothetical protein QVD17_11859 [Tagetes erecta]|uniref:Uncharacterized protein n=1 Tax=Tagetes erecta TaxID=13708 RepID=A0AAD8NVC5_TARER|nr:hypothetical protein QVD17_11859 [Tagetes erecta]